MRGIVALLVAGFLFVSIFLLYPSVRSEETVGNTLYVGGSGPGNYSSIQDAINTSTDGDTIFVYNGVYTEYVTIDKSINLIGENKETTIVDEEGKSELGYVFRLFADYINLTGFTIQNSFANIDSTDEYLFGIYVNSNNSKIFGNIITKSIYGIYLYNSFNNTITTNKLKEYSTGIVLWQSSDNKIENNEITTNNQYSVKYDSKEGIFMFDSHDNIITNNTISNYSSGISLFHLSENNTIYYNNFINNTQNANDSGNNSWDNGKYGNYWDNYNGLDKNNDGIGDTPYNIPGGNNQDKYPLMMPYDGTIRLKEFYIDQGSVFTMLIIGMIVVIIFLLPIAYIWYKKGWR